MKDPDDHDSVAFGEIENDMFSLLNAPKTGMKPFT